MAKLIMSLDGSIIREIVLDKDRLTIGRKPANDIQIENLAVSGEHARIVTILNDTFLEDLNSTNGTLVNGTPVKKHILQNNDLIEIGKYKLKFIAEGSLPQPAQAPPDDLEKTMVLRPGASTHRAAAPPPPPPPPPAPVATAFSTVAAIQVLNGPAAGREMEFTKDRTRVGKSGVQVAEITKGLQGYFIAHVGGDKFPVVNGRTLDAQACPLHDHDVIEIAGVKMEFFFKSR